MTDELGSIPGQSLIRGDLRLDWDELGEGISGDYDPDNPADVELLRFTLYRREDGEWVEADDASYCTNVSVATDTTGRQRLLEGLMDEFAPAAADGNSVKKLAERLSWIDEEWYQPCEHPDCPRDAAGLVDGHRFCGSHAVQAAYSEPPPAD